MESIVCNQLFSRRGLGYLWSKRTELDPGQEKIINSLYNNRKKGQIEGQQSITYKLSNKRAGKLGYGRYYGTIGSLETLERECRGTLCKDYYIDIDIVNCHPVLLLQFAKQKYNKDLPETEYYIDHRDEVLKAISDNRDEAKQEVIRIFYGGRNKHTITGKLSEEVKKFSKFVSTQEEYSELFKICKDEDNIYGTFMSYVLQTEERKVMLTMKEYLEKEKWSVDVLAYDGVMIRKREDCVVDFEELEAYIEKKTNYKVKTLEKEMIGFDVPETDEEIVKGVTKTEYLKMKEEFEKNHFYYYPENSYAEVKDDVLYMDENHALKYFRNKYHFKLSDKKDDYVEFFPLWLKDVNKKIIKSISFKESDDPEIFYKPLSFKYQKLESQPFNDEVINIFNYLISLVCNHNKILEEYVTKYLAHMLQKPFDLPGVALIILGEKGCGKDTLFDFIGEFVVGFSYFSNYQSNKQFFDKYDTGRLNKFLVKLEEADPKYFNEDASLIKSLITANMNTFNPKLKPIIYTNNYIRFIFTTNKPSIGDMTQGERRYVFSPCSTEKMGDLDYWDTVRDTIFNPLAGRIVADYLLNCDISGFTPRKLPVTDYQTAVIDSQKSSEQLFLESWNGEDADMNDLFNDYRSYCCDNNLPFVPNSIALGKKLLPFIAKNIITKKRKADGVYYNKM